MSQFEFLVTTEKNIFGYKLFLSLNISHSIFLCENFNPPPPEKSHPPLSQQPPVKVEVLPSPPFFENLVGGSTPARKKGGMHTMVYKYSPTIMLEIFRFQNNIGYHLKRQNSFKTSLRNSINNGTGSISYLGPEV